MEKHLSKACEEVDASIFSGDVLYTEDDLSVLIYYIKRWNKAIIEHLSNKQIDDTKEMN